MKCRYKYCKFGGQVDKEDAVKEKNYYYHKACYKEKQYKKQIEDFYYDKFPPNESIQIVRRAINNYVHKDCYDPQYILFVLHKQIKLNSIFGLKYYLQNNEFQQEFQKEKAKILIYKQNNNSVKIENPSSFQYKPPQQQRWGDLICQ